MDRSTLREYNRRMPQLRVRDNPSPRRVRRFEGGIHGRKLAADANFPVGFVFMVHIFSVRDASHQTGKAPFHR